MGEVGARRCVSRRAALRLAGFALASPAMVWLASSLAGCESTPSGYSGPTITPGTLTIISPVTWPPFYVDTGGEDEGLGVTMCETLGEELALTIDAKTCASESEVYDALRAHEADLGGVITRPEEVPSGILLSDSIMPCNISVVSKGALREQDLSDLDTPETTIYAVDRPIVREWIDSTFHELHVIYDADPLAVLNAVRSGYAPFCVLTRPEALYYLNSVYSTLTEGLMAVTGENFAFAVLEDNEELLNAVDGIIEELEDSGEIASLEARWFGTQLSHQ